MGVDALLLRGQLSNLTLSPIPCGVACLGRVHAVSWVSQQCGKSRVGGQADRSAPWPGGCTCSPGSWPSPLVREAEWWAPQIGQGGRRVGSLEQKRPLPSPVLSQLLSRPPFPAGLSFSRDAGPMVQVCPSSLPGSTSIKMYGLPFCLSSTFLVCAAGGGGQ